MSELKLKACPFCGNETAYLVESCNEHWINCPCGASSEMKSGSETVVVLCWNRRPLEEKLAARIAELEAERDKLKAAELAAGEMASVLQWALDAMPPSSFDPESVHHYCVALAEKAEEVLQKARGEE